MKDKYSPKASMQGFILLGAIIVAFVSLLAVAGPGGLLIGLALLLHYWTFPRSSASSKRNGGSAGTGDPLGPGALVSLSGGADTLPAVAIPPQARRQRRELARVLAEHGPAPCEEGDPELWWPSADGGSAEAASGCEGARPGRHASSTRWPTTSERASGAG